MLAPRAALGVVQVVFYGPIALLVLHLAFIRHGQPRMPWFFLLMFSCFRIASGIVSILYQQHGSSTSLLIAAVITLNVGVIPLLLCTIGFILVITQLDHADSNRLQKSIVIIRLGFLIGIALLVTGSVFVGMYNSPNLPKVGSQLTKAGYVVIACILATMAGFEIFFWNRYKLLARSSRICLQAITVAMPFQVVRIAYALLEVFNGTSAKWSVLTGPLGVYIGMVLIMEYVVVIVYVVTGFIIGPVGKGIQS